MLYDLKKIQEEILPIHVCNHFGIQYIGKGNRKFIHCPEHLKKLGVEDKHIGNCILGNDFKNAYYCFACHARGSVFDFIANINNLDVKKDFYKVVSLAAECLGDDREFQIEDTTEYEENKKKIKESLEDKVRLKESDLELLQLNNVFIETVNECFTDNIDDLLRKDINFNNLSGNGIPEVNFLDIKTKNVSITNLMISNYDLYCKIVKERCLTLLNNLKENIEKDYSSLIKKIGIHDEKEQQYFLDDLIHKYKMKYLDVKSIYFQFLNEEEKEKFDISWLFE